MRENMREQETESEPPSASVVSNSNLLLCQLSATDMASKETSGLESLMSSPLPLKQVSTSGLTCSISRGQVKDSDLRFGIMNNEVIN